MKKTFRFIYGLLLAVAVLSFTACDDDNDTIVLPLDTSKSVLTVEEFDVRMDFFLTNRLDERTVVFHEGEDIFFNVDVTNLSDTTGIAHAEAMRSFCYDPSNYDIYGRPIDPSTQDSLRVAEDFLRSHSMSAWGTTDLFNVYTSEGKFVGRPWSNAFTTLLYIPIYGPDGQYHIKLPWYFTPGSTCCTGYITSYQYAQPTGGNTTYYAAEKIHKLKPGNYYAIAVVGASLNVNEQILLTCRIDFQIEK